MFNIKNIVNKITDRGRESNPNSPGRGPNDDDELSSQRAEGFLCPRCMKAFASAPELQLHYESLHGEESALDTPAASAASFHSFHQEVGERYKLPQEDTPSSSGPGMSIHFEEVSSITDVTELQKTLQEVLENRAILQSEKDRLEQRAAHLAQLNVTLRAACDEGESSQAALKERLKVVEAQLAHRESIDDAAVLRQELVQVQRVMDELNREREKERDALRDELQQLQGERTQEVISDEKDILREKEHEISQLNLDLQSYKNQILELTTKHADDNLKIKDLSEELTDLREQLRSISINNDKEKKALEHDLLNISKERDGLKEVLHGVKEESEKLKVSSCQDIDDLQSKLNEITLTNQQVDEELNRTRNELTVLKKEKENLRAELFQKSRLFDDMEQTKASCEKNIEELTNALTQSKLKIAQLENEHAELLAQIQVGEGATTAIQQLTQENNSLQLRLQEEADRNMKAREDSRHAIQDIMKQLGDSEKTKRNLELTLENQHSEFLHMKAEMDVLIEECRGLEKKLATKEAGFEQLRTANERLKHEHEEKYSSLEEDLKQKSIELFQSNARINGLEREESELRSEMSRLQTINSHLKAEIDSTVNQVLEVERRLNSSQEAYKILQGIVDEHTQVISKKEEECSSLESEKMKITEEMFALTDKLKATENQLQIVGVQRASLETSLFEMQKSMADLESEKKDIEEEKLKEISSLRDMVKAKSEILDKREEAVQILMAEKLTLTELLKTEQITHEEDMKEIKEKCEQLQTELGACLQCKDNIETNLSMEIQKRLNLEGELEKLSVTLDSARKEHIAKEKSLQASLDEVSGEKLALEVQLEANHAERQALLERCYASASETETLHRTIADLRRKLDESQAALHELGRENQTLQLDIDKLIGRKWAEDSEVNQCTLCHRDFSLILRKHHCRNCGQIFCNECSSKTAPIASNKKPVRVCDSCYGELTPK